eukprot:m.310733 g.310733  ORF g.310733 m.310733 type:complete len:358 (+) comp54267_c0_seq1:103-1176(+)
MTCTCQRSFLRLKLANLQRAQMDVVSKAWLRDFGFRDDVVDDFFAGLGHQTISYWASLMGRKAFESSFAAAKSLPEPARSFYRLGMREDACERLSGEVHEDLLRHQQPIYLLDLILDKRLGCWYLDNYPFCEEVTMKWEEVPESRLAAINSQHSGYGPPSQRKLPVYNGAKWNVVESSKVIEKLQKKDCVMLYHATTWASAEVISKYGCDTLKGKTNQDFSDCGGYYLHYDLAGAVDWAQKKTSDQQRQQASILVYACPDSDFPSREQKVQNFGRSSGTLWKKTIAAYRSGNPRELDVYDVDAIIGCICTNPRDFSTPANFKPQQKQGQNVMQLCVKSRKMEKEMDSFLAGIVFFSS